MSTSSASLAASILNNLCAKHAQPATTLLPIVEHKQTPSVSSDEYDEEEEDYDSMPFSSSGEITHIQRLRANFAQYGLDMSKVYRMMLDTSMVIGGGFMVNHILAMNGLDKPLCPSSDIDFYVFGGIPPIFSGAFGGKEYRDHLSKSIQARTFRSLVTRRFYDLVSPLGYTYSYLDDEDYEVERAETGDRLFTSRSNIRMSVVYYTATINGIKKKLNLVFCDTDMYTLISKVDISLTAGFLCPSTFNESFDYHHVAPQDVREHRLAWLQPESTHTPRQIERMAKYRQRYDLLEQKKMTTAEFIRDWDSLPDTHLHVILVGREDEIYSTPVVRRVQGLPRLKFSVEMNNYSFLCQSTTFSRFPSVAEIEEYRRQKAKESQQVTATAAAAAAAMATGGLFGTVKRPGHIIYADEDEDEYDDDDDDDDDDYDDENDA